ncbi:MAG: CotH kinase family protein, partial [Anaerolineae bacterium]|nr:CotH kinase family protein [Anaerolineae bacterium]
DPAVQSELPVLYWFVADPTAAETDAGSRASVFYDGVLYDNVLVRLRGLTARYWPKKSLKFDFNQGHHFRYARDRAPVEEFNLNATVTDKSYLRQVLSWEAYRDAGVPSSISFPVRVQRNGRFYSVAIFVEQPDERYLLRQGLDPEGALYKMLKRNLLDSATSNVEKRTRLDEDASDLQGLIDGLNLLPRERTRFMFEQVNVPEVINYLAVATVLHDRDQGDNNYYMYRGAGASDRWMVLPWDKDMTFGRTYLPDAGGTFNDVIWADQDPESHPLQPYYVGNRLFDALLADPVIREMYLRRLRTVMDLLLQPPGTPASARVFERRIDAWYDQMAADVALDAERWPLEWGEPQSFAQAVAAIVDGYLPARRVHLYQTHGASGSGLVPEAQPRRVRVRFGEVELDPPSGNQDEEYLTLVNDNPYAVDVSGWKVVYDVEYTFQPGVVIPAGDRIYVSPDVAAFYRRYGDVPGMGERLVQGNYRGQLSNTWGALKLYDAGDRLVNMQVFHDRDLLDR